jgi:hypothetical protein
MHNELSQHAGSYNNINRSQPDIVCKQGPSQLFIKFNYWHHVHLFAFASLFSINSMHEDYIASINRPNNRPTEYDANNHTEFQHMVCTDQLIMTSCYASINPSQSETRLSAGISFVHILSSWPTNRR